MFESVSPPTAVRLMQSRAAWAPRSQPAPGIALLTCVTPWSHMSPGMGGSRGHRNLCSPRGTQLQHHILIVATSVPLHLHPDTFIPPKRQSPPPSILPPAPGAKLINPALLIGSDFTLLCRGSSSGSDRFPLFSLEGAERANLDLDLEFLNV